MNTSTANFNLILKPSRVLLLVFGFFYLLAIISILLLSLHAGIKVVSVAIIILMAYIQIKQYALLLSKDAIKHINCTSKMECRLELNNKHRYLTRIVSASWLFNYFAVLVLQNSTKKFSVIIAKDALSQAQFYTLRLYLRSLNN